jgi:hypothetical protein
MTQYALMMQGVLPDLVLASNEDMIRRTLRNGKVAVWMPIGLMSATPNEMTNWDTTSDSLAAWLSTSLNAERLLVVKSCELAADTPLDALASAGVLDARFVEYVNDANYVVELFNKGDVALMRERLLNTPAA